MSTPDYTDEELALIIIKAIEDSKYSWRAGNLGVAAMVNGKVEAQGDHCAVGGLALAFGLKKNRVTNQAGIVYVEDINVNRSFSWGQGVIFGNDSLEFQSYGGGIRGNLTSDFANGYKVGQAVRDHFKGK